MIQARAGAGRATDPLAPYLLLAGLWLVATTIVPPAGNFPLNDDWMYAKVVKHLVETNHYEASPYADPTFILQAYWGAGFAKLFGFSFETLRASTLVFGLVAIWAAHWAAREAGLNARWAVLVAITLLVNPLFINMSYTFMTDIPFLALSTLAGAAYLRAVRTDRLRWIGIATATGVVAYFVRQFAVVVVVAAFISCTAWSPASVRKIRQTLLFLVPLLVAGLLYKLLPIGGLEMAMGWDWNRLGNTWAERTVDVARHYTISFAYLAVYVFPLSLAGRWRDFDIPTADSASGVAGMRLNVRTFRAAATRRNFVLAVTFLICALLMVPVWPHRLPNLGNLLYDCGIGPILMPGMLDGLSIVAPFRLGRVFWWIVTGFGLIGATLLAALHLRAAVAALTSHGRADVGKRSEIFLALWSFGTVLVLTLPPVLARFDRYFVVAQVPVSILLGRWLAARHVHPSRTAYVAVGLMFAVSLICLQDYLAWNAARWKGLGELQTAHHAATDEINGGYEFNGWYHSDQFADDSRRTRKKVFGPLGWWTVKDEYRVSMRQPKHFEVIGKVPYFSWLGFAHREILLLHRTTPDPFP